MKKEKIVPTITDLFAQAKIHLHMFEESGKASQTDPDSVLDMEEHVADLHEAFMALYPNLMPNPLKEYRDCMYQYVADANQDIARAAQALWVSGKDDIGEVGVEIPVETPNNIPLSMAQVAPPSRKEGRSLSLSHRAARGAKEKAVETKEGVHRGRQSLRSKISHRIEKWAHQLDEK